MISEIISSVHLKTLAGQYLTSKSACQRATLNLMPSLKLIIFRAEGMTCKVKTCYRYCSVCYAVVCDESVVANSTELSFKWVDKCTVDLDSDFLKTESTESILLLYRSQSGTAIAKNIFDSASIREKLSYMYPGEIIQNMSNHELREALGG